MELLTWCVAVARITFGLPEKISALVHLELEEILSGLTILT